MLPIDLSPAAAVRDPVFSPDGRRIAFAADRGDGFDLFIVDAKGGAPRQLAMMAGDERWPSWTRDGRLVFAHRDGGPLTAWDLYIVQALESDTGRSAASPNSPGGGSAPVRLTDSADDEFQPRASPDGERIAFMATRDSDDLDVDLWVMATPPAGETKTRRPVRILSARGFDGCPYSQLR